jgi:4-cresol dehydrogenase (hydroxylating)
LGDFKQTVDMFYHGPPKLPARQQELIAGTKVGYSAELERYGLDNSIPYWELRLTFYGPPKVIGAQWEACCDVATKMVKGSTFKADPIMTFPMTKAQQDKVRLQHIGVPNLEFFAFGSRAGGNPDPSSGHMAFAPVIPRSGEAIIEANRVFEEASHTVDQLKVMIIGLRPFALPNVFYERGFLYILGFPVMDDPEQNKAFVGAFRELIRIAAQHGWGEYRTPVIFQDQVMETYSFNDHSLLRFHETIKDAVDPKGILSPGRYGIWPKHLRKERKG